jgi:cytochrome c oxidase assembly protein subunit 11
MRINTKRIWYLIALGLFTLLAIGINATHPSINVNDRFVIYVVLICVDIFALLLLFMPKNILRNMLLLIVGMTAFGFVLVPLYDVFCNVTGLNGKLDLTVTAATDRGVDSTRTVTVEFVVNQNQDMPWEFKPKHNQIVVHPGELSATAYFAKNTTNATMYAQAIPSISPARVRKYFKKVECFCFTHQKLGPGETAYLGLRFYLDPDFPKDVQRVTLAYTIFDITNKER